MSGKTQKAIITTPMTCRQPISIHQRRPRGARSRSTGARSRSTTVLTISDLLALAGLTEAEVRDQADHDEDENRQGARQAVLLGPALECHRIDHRDEDVG